MATKISLTDLKNNESWNEAVIVFTKDSFVGEFSETERSYKVNRDSKYFNPDMIGNSLLGDCLDGTDNGVRLDMYMSLLPDEGKRWTVDYCYVS